MKATSHLFSLSPGTVSNPMRRYTTANVYPRRCVSPIHRHGYIIEVFVGQRLYRDDMSNRGLLKM